MQTYTQAKNDPGASPAVKTTLTWIDRWVCEVHPKQHVIGNRLDADDNPISQQAYDANEPKAQVCPFVHRSKELDTIWIEESPAISEVEIARYLSPKIVDFVSALPNYDPGTTGQPAGDPAIFKTFLCLFPQCKHLGGYNVVFDAVHSKLKLDFVKRGLMLGQFYYGCESEGIHNPQFRPLYSPYPMFVIRYMVRADDLFNLPGTPYHDEYRKYFP